MIAECRYTHIDVNTNTHTCERSDVCEMYVVIVAIDVQSLFILGNSGSDRSDQVML